MTTIVGQALPDHREARRDPEQLEVAITLRECGIRTGIAEPLLCERQIGSAIRRSLPVGSRGEHRGDPVVSEIDHRELLGAGVSAADRSLAATVAPDRNPFAIVLGGPLL